MVKLTTFLSDNRTSDEDDNKDEIYLILILVSLILEHIYSHLELDLKLGKVNQPKQQMVIFVVIMFCEKRVDWHTIQSVMYMIYHQLFYFFLHDSTPKDICKYTNKEGYYKLKDNWTPIETDELKKLRCC